MFPRTIIANEARPERPRVSESAINLFYAISGIASIFVFAVGIFVVAGWLFHVEILRTLYFSPVEMKANTAIAIVLIGLSLWFVQTIRTSSRMRFISNSCALIAALIGSLTLFEYLFNLNIGIDQALFVDIPDPEITSNAGRMAPSSAVEFVLIGIALFLIDFETRRGFRPSQFIAIAACLLALVFTMGYVYGIAPLYKPSFYNAMALHASLAFLIASAGILTARPDKGIMIFLVKDSLGSVIARRLLIAISVAPLLIDTFLISGQITGLYGRNYTSAIDDILLMIIVISIILHTSRHIDKIDAKRRKAEEEVESLARFPRDNPNPVIRIDRELNVLLTNESCKPLLIPLGFHKDGDRLIAGEKWRDLIVATLDAGHVTSFEMPLNEKMFHFTLAPLQDMDYVNIYGYDITIQKQAVEERESTAKFPGENPYPVIRMDSNLNVLYTNKSSKPLFTYLGFHKDGDSLIADERWRTLIVSALESGQVTSVEVPVDERVFHFTIAPIRGKNYVNLYGYDITKRKLAEKALNHEKNKIQNILDSMQDGIYIVNGNYQIEYANPVVVREFGPYEDIKCFTYFHDTSGACPWCRNEEVFQGKTVHWEFTMLRTGKTYDIIDTPITNQDGSISKLEIFRDITIRKQMENKLQLFSQAIEETIDTVHIVDMSGKIIYSNKASAKLTGYTTGESLGMDVVNLTQDRYFSANVIIPTIYAKGYWDGEISCVRKDGSIYHAWLAANLFNDNDGKPIAMIGTLRDITSKKEIEEAYRTSEANIRALMNAITESVCLINTDGVFITVNDTFAKRFSTENQKEAEDIVGTNFRDIFSPDVFETKKGYLEEVISTGLPVSFENTRGESLCLTNMYPVFGDDHKVSGVAIYASDITLRKKYETYLLTSIREKEILMREIHHRVKNNLQIVAGLIGLQLNNITDETYKAMFNETKNRIKSIALVHDKLYRSKGLAEVDFQKYISELSNELFSSFGVDKNHITLAIDMENIIIGVDIAVPCGLIINELFTNILKYAFPDKMIGEINISVHSDNEGKFEMVISDSGVGFPENIDFRNAKSLGLHIVNILVRQIGGTIELDKTRGSKFTIKFEHSIKL